jgi:hypothetical protein
MEEKKLVIADTDVIIEFLDRDNRSVKQKLLSLGINNLFLSEVTAAELVYGARDKKHLITLTDFVTQCVVLSLHEDISKLHFKLVHLYALSHKLKVQDALIAATAIYWELDLFTFNKRDFKFIEGLKLL